jgi:predicted HNH restriction endonuclease
MKMLQLWPAFPRGTSKGNQYQILNDLCIGIAKSIEVDLWSLDGLWHIANEIGRQNTNLTFEGLEQDERDFLEGKKVQTTGFRIERNTKAREKCLSKKGHSCAVCGFNFFTTFGELGMGFIHVHHCEDLALRTEERSTDPEKELVPVCPNCHAMLHKGAKPCRSIEELKSIIETQKVATSQAQAADAQSAV